MSQFIEMFGNQDKNDREWAIAKIKDEFNLTMGKTPSRANHDYWVENGCKWVSIADMANYSKYTDETAEHISQKAINECGLKAIEPNTIIMSFKLSIGRTAITSERIYTNEAIMAFRDINEKKFDLDFLFFTLSTKNWLKYAKQAVKGATLNKESIGNSNIIVPPLSIQKEFATILQQADKSKFELKQCIDNIDKVIKSLING